MRRVVATACPLPLLTCADGKDEGLTEANIRFEWAEQICEHAQECDCEVADFETCREDNTAFFLQIQQPAEDADLTFDGACAQRVLDGLTADCEAYPTLECSALCDIWYGTGELGEACESLGVPYASRCAQGLTCLFGECVDPCTAEIDPVGEGETCFENGETVAVCAAEFLCDFAGTQTCLARPAIGEPCVGFQCGIGAYCDVEAEVCAAQVGEGDACVDDIECETISCVDGICGERPAFVCGYVY